MTNEVMVILDLSDDVQTLIEQQDINLYEELQREEPSLRLEVQPDPTAPKGSRDAITVILAISVAYRLLRVGFAEQLRRLCEISTLRERYVTAISTLVGSLTPLIIRILNQFTPPNRTAHWEVEEIETRHPDGTTTIHRKRIRSSDEQRPWTTLPYPNSQPSTPSGQTSIPEHRQDTQQ